MKRILLDTNFYVAFKRGEKSSVAVVRKATDIGISTIVLGELLAGFRCGKRMTENYRELEQFLNSPRVVTLSIDEETTEFYARIFRSSERKVSRFQQTIFGLPQLLYSMGLSWRHTILISATSAVSSPLICNRRCFNGHKISFHDRARN